MVDELDHKTYIFGNLHSIASRDEDFLAESAHDVALIDLAYGLVIMLLLA